MRPKLFTAILATTIGIWTASAETASPENPKPPKQPPRPIIFKPVKEDITLRPKAPSLQQITCVYDGEHLHLDFVLPEGECTLTLSGGVNATCSFDSSELNAEVYVGGISDETELTLTTEYGHQYSGTLIF